MMFLAILPLLFTAVHCYIYINDENDENCSALLNISLSVSESVSGSWLSQCPPWFAPGNLSTGTCSPGPSLDGLIEQDLSLMQTRIINCYCMTEENGSFVVGFCLHQCIYFSFYSLPCLRTELENWSCPPHLHREGNLCSECAKDHRIPVYSYSTECVRCENYEYNWLKYLAVAYLPLTVFYLFVALFSINFVSPKLGGVVIIFKIVGNPSLVGILSLCCSLLHQFCFSKTRWSCNNF